MELGWGGVGDGGGGTGDEGGWFVGGCEGVWTGAPTLFCGPNSGFEIHIGGSSLGTLFGVEREAGNPKGNLHCKCQNTGTLQIHLFGFNRSRHGPSILRVLLF